MADRRAHLVRLEGRSPRSIERARIALFDALRTASLADDGRLIVCRTLDLGPIREDSSPATLALLVEARMREAATTAVPVDDRRADNAAAISFRSHTHALAWSLSRVADLRRPVPWFVDRLLEWRGDEGPAARTSRLARIVTRLTTHEAGRAAVRTWLGRAPTRGDLHEVLQLDDDAFAHQLATCVGLALLRTPSHSAEAGVPVFVRAMADAASSHPRGSARAALAAAAVAIARRPSLASAGDALHALVSQALAADLVEHRRAALEVVDVPSMHAPRISPARTSDSTPRRESCEHHDALTAKASPTPRAGSPLDVDATTCVGGLLFTLRIFEVTGLAAAFGSPHEGYDRPLARDTLRAVARRADPEAPDDPLLEWLDALAEEDGEPSLVDPARAEAIADGVARWLALHADLSLGELVRRPGQLGVDELELVVAFRMDQLDVRVRRAGLDIDPGFVPALGRVVRYVYDDAWHPVLRRRTR